MRENRDLWNAWSDAFQGAWEADTEEGELPPAGVHLGPGAGDQGTREAVLPDLDGVDAVELGCGGGQGTVGLAREGADAVGVDFSTAQLGHARRLRDAYDVEADFVAGDVRTLPLAAAAFDLAYCSWVFQMVDDLDACFAEARRVLRPGGAFVLAVPHPFYETFDPEARELDRSYSSVRKSLHTDGGKRPRPGWVIGSERTILRLGTGAQDHRRVRPRPARLPPPGGRLPPRARR